MEVQSSSKTPVVLGTKLVATPHVLGKPVLPMAIPWLLYVFVGPRLSKPIIDAPQATLGVK